MQGTNEGLGIIGGGTGRALSEIDEVNRREERLDGNDDSSNPFHLTEFKATELTRRYILRY